MDVKKLPELDLKLLVIFDEIRRLRSITLAAESLNVTQSAISKSLQRLRSRFDDALFVRTPGGMEPTSRARELEAPIAEILRTYFERIAAAPPFDPATSNRVFTIQASDMGMSVFLPILVPEVKRRAPHVRIHAMTGSQREIVEGLECGDIDISLGAFSVLSDGGVCQQRLFEEHYICLVRKGHPACGAPVFDADLFQRYSHIIISAGKTGHVHGKVETMLLREFPCLNVALKVPSFVMGAMLLRGTDHILTIPSTAATVFAPEFELVGLESPVPLPEFSVLQYWHERFSRDPGGQWLRGIIRETFQDRYAILARNEPGKRRHD
jgi:DNA-binding transcriptional LysR family regulator